MYHAPIQRRGAVESGCNYLELFYGYCQGSFNNKNKLQKDSSLHEEKVVSEFRICFRSGLNYLRKKSLCFKYCRYFGKLKQPIGNTM